MMTSLTTRSTHGPANRCVGCAPRTSHYAGGCTASNPIEAAASRLSALQHNEIERVASELLIDGRDIWRAEADVQAYVDEQFEGIIADKVIESAKQLLRDRPYLGRPPTGPPPTQRPSKACGVAPRPRKNRKRRPGTRRYAAAKLADRAHGPGAQRNTNAPGGEHVTALGG